MRNKRNLHHGIYYVRQKELKESKHGKKFLRLELCNKNERRFAYFWENCDHHYKKIHFNSILDVDGEFKKLNDKDILELSGIRYLKQEKKILSKYFVKDEQLEWFTEIKKSMPLEYQTLLKQLFSIDRLTQFFLIPSGKLWAFAEEGGLFAKTNELFKLLDQLSEETIKLSLIKLALLLQSIAFIEGSYHQKLFEYKSDAKFLGIPILALSKVSSFIDESQLSESDKEHLKHLILMHPNYSQKQTAEWKSLEAMLLYKGLDIIILKHALKELKNKTENKNRKWSNYNKLLERYIYLE